MGKRKYFNAYSFLMSKAVCEGKTAERVLMGAVQGHCLRPSSFSTEWTHRSLIPAVCSINKLNYTQEETEPRLFLLALEFWNGFPFRKLCHCCSEFYRDMYT